MIDQNALTDDYISRKRAIAEFQTCDSVFVYGYSGCAAIISRLKVVSAADVRPVVRGKWKIHYYELDPGGSTIECSVCREEQPLGIDDNFCPNCGADMREAL